MDFESGNEVWSVSGTSFGHRSQEDGSVARPPSPHPWPVRVSATRASANGARWEHRLDAGTVGGFGQLPPRRRVIMPDGEWEVMPMGTPMPEEENIREREEEKMRWLQEMGKKIEMTSEEQRWKEERERHQKQAATLNKDLEIDDGEEVRRRKFDIRREGYRHDDYDDSMSEFDRRPLERLEDRIGRIPAPVGLQRAAAGAPGAARELENDTEESSKIEPLNIVKAAKPFLHNSKDEGIDSEVAKKVQEFMADLKRKVVAPEPLVPKPDVKNLEDAQVYRKCLHEHPIYTPTGLYEQVVRANATIEEAWEPRKAREQAGELKDEAEQEADEETSDGDDEINTRATWLGW